jgi:hypothetical protein
VGGDRGSVPDHRGGVLRGDLGVFAHHSWWEAVALGSAAIGVLALLTFSIAAPRGGESGGTVAWNVFVHVLMLAGLFVLLLVPSLERWVDHHVMSG